MTRHGNFKFFPVTSSHESGGVFFSTVTPLFCSDAAGGQLPGPAAVTAGPGRLPGPMASSSVPRRGAPSHESWAAAALSSSQAVTRDSGGAG